MQEEGQGKARRCAPLRPIGSLWEIHIEISRRQLYESGAKKKKVYTRNKNLVIVVNKGLPGVQRLPLIYTERYKTDEILWNNV